MTPPTRAVICEAWGGPDTLVLRPVPLPVPGHGQVRIVTELTSVNFADIHSRRGGYDVGATPPFTPGLDCVGLIDAVGDGVAGLRVGQRVAAWTSGGSYAEDVLASAALTYELPEGVTATDGASLTVLVTAYNALVRGQLIRGESVLVHGASRGVGAAAVQYAMAMGAGAVYASVGGPEKAHAALWSGATVAIDHTAVDFAERVLELTDGAGVDVIVDPIGGEVTERGMTCLAPFGRLVTCGHTPGPAASIASTDLHRQNRAVLGYSTGHFRRARPQVLRPAVEAVFDYAASGAVKVAVAARFPLALAADAHRLVESRSAVGRVLLDPHLEPAEPEGRPAAPGAPAL